MYIVADIGGTKTRIAHSSDLEKFEEPIILDTPQDYTEGLATVSAAVSSIRSGQSIDAMCVGAAGALSRDKRQLLGAHHLPFWKNRPLAEDLEKMLSTKVVMENDTSLVGLGEAVYGAGVGAGIVVYITVSTGVNGVRIVDGKIDRSAMGFEVGGQYLFVGDVPKSLEDLISGSATQEKYGKHPKEIEKDSPVWEEMALLTAYGVHNTILHWSPDRVVLGGSMFNEIGIPVPRVHEHVKKIMHKFPSVPDIVHSGLGDVGGLYGGMAQLKSLVKSLVR